jgi:hypothetical protein
VSAYLGGEGWVSSSVVVSTVRSLARTQSPHFFGKHAGNGHVMAGKSSRAMF